MKGCCACGYDTVLLPYQYVVVLQIQLKSLAEEMQAVSKGLEKVEQEIAMSENDGPASAGFRTVCQL